VRTSKKLSEPRATIPPHSALVFFVDRSCGGKQVPDALRALGLNVVAHQERFPETEDDIPILEECGRQHWVYIAKDLAVRKNPAELRALRKARIHAIFLHGRRRPAMYIIENFRAALPRIMSTLAGAKAPVHLMITAGGRVEAVR
jgi:PIN like domain